MNFVVNLFLGGCVDDLIRWRGRVEYKFQINRQESQSEWEIDDWEELQGLLMAERKLKFQICIVTFFKCSYTDISKQKKETKNKGQYKLEIKFIMESTDRENFISC